MASALEDHLEERVRRTLDFDDDSDWVDVLSRADRKRPSTSRRLLLGAAVLTGLAAVLVAPGPGLGYLRDLFGGEPAPPAVENVIAQVDKGAPANLAPGVDATQTHKLLEIRTSSGLSATLWVAPTRSGGVCAYLQRGPTPKGGPGCYDALSPATQIDWSMQGAASDTDQATLLYGRVSDKISRLELRFDDGTIASLPLSQSFFLYEIPVQQLRTGHRPTLLVGYEDENEIARAVIFSGYGIYTPSAQPSSDQG